MKQVGVLFVCLGNICRSPLAEAIFKHRVQQESLDHFFTVDSCGTSSYHIGDPPDRRTMSNARRHGVEIRHLGRQIEINDLVRFDFILAMDQNNLRDIKRIQYADQLKHKLYLMRHFDPVSPDGDVPDPYYGDEAGFEEVYTILDRSIGSFLDYLKKNVITV